MPRDLKFARLSLPAALLVFLPAAAGAKVVAADSAFPASGQRREGAAVSAWLLAFTGVGRGLVHRGQLPFHSSAYLTSRYALHATEIQRAFAKEAGAALHVMSQYRVVGADRAGERRLRGTEDGDHGDSERRGKVHRAGVIG